MVIIPMGHQAISRRQFLKRIGVGTASVSLVSLTFPTGCHPSMQETPPLEVLSPTQYRTMEAFAERFFPKESPIGISAREVHVTQGVDRAAKRLPALKRWMIGAALWLFETLPRLTYGKRFTHLSSEQQLEYMKNWEASTWSLKRGGFLMMKGVVCLAYYRHPKVRERIGFYRTC
ncbi:MAG: gluconate 2-dehydrogenase subunit 3 family protein [Deltaproteobacteria bacterium]|nr:gluconate 2-dehydrogenase subunit 3 family protein [Deltaproteobacteria bacterium]